MVLIDFEGNIVNDTSFLSEGNIVFYGASSRNKSAIESLGIKDRVVCYIDRDESKKGNIVDGYSIDGLDVIRNTENLIIISMLIECADEVSDFLKDSNVRKFFCYPDSEKVAKLVSYNNVVLNKIKKCKYVHFFNNEKFFVPFYNMVEECFDIREHFFVIDYVIKGDVYKFYDTIVKKNDVNNNIMAFTEFKFMGNNSNLNKIENVIYEAEEYKKILDSADKIIMHNLSFGRNFYEHIIECVKCFADKMAWIAWGGDTYLEGDDFRVTEILQKIRWCYTFPAREQYIKECYKVIPIVRKASYMYISKKDDCKKEQRNVKDNETLKILLGHSAAEYSNHRCGFDLLKKYKDESIEIICPLSYGSEEYRKKVVEEGKRIFKDKFIPVLNFMELDEYYKFLKGIDVAILPMKRIAAGTTIVYLDQINVPVYLLSDIKNEYLMSEFYTRDLSEIEDLSYEEFCEVVKRTDLNVNKNNIEFINEWKKMFND